MNIIINEIVETLLQYVGYNLISPIKLTKFSMEQMIGATAQRIDPNDEKWMINDPMKAWS